MAKSSNFFGQPEGWRGRMDKTAAHHRFNDSFMLAPSHYKRDEIAAMDRAYINYAKFEELTDRGVVYVTKMKKSLNYEVLVACMRQNPQGLMEYRERVVVITSISKSS